MDVPKGAGKADLEGVIWRRGMSVCQDGRDNIYVLDASSGRVDQFSPNGDRRGGWVVPGWEGVEASPILSGFACDRRGETFAFGRRGDVRVFGEKGISSAFKIPTFVTGLGFVKGGLVAARLPVQFGQSEPKQSPFQRHQALVTRFRLDGEVLGESVAPDQGQAPDNFTLAMTQDVGIAVDHRSGNAWIADRHRLYRLRRLSFAGQVTGEWISDKVRADVQFVGQVPEEAKGRLTPDAVAKFQPVDAPMIVRDVVARDGLVFVLTNPGAITELPFIDVFSGASEGPAWRIGLRVEGGVYFDQLAVTESALWLFPVAPGEHPRRVERAPDYVMLKSISPKPDDLDEGESSRD